MSTYTVTAGHGDGDPGAVYAGYSEADLMAELRDLVADRLVARGHTVRTDGRGKVNRALTYAMTLIGGSRLAIELHTNAFSDPLATGVEVVSLPAQAPQAKAIAAAISDVLGLRRRGTYGWIDQSQSARGRLGFVRMGGLVVESFFLSNAHDRAIYLASRPEVAEAIAAAMVAA